MILRHEASPFSPAGLKQLVGTAVLYGLLIASANHFLMTQVGFELRPSTFIPVVAGLLFGLPAALGAGLGNFCSLLLYLHRRTKVIYYPLPQPQKRYGGLQQQVLSLLVLLDILYLLVPQTAMLSGAVFAVNVLLLCYICTMPSECEELPEDSNTFSLASSTNKLLIFTDGLNEAENAAHEFYGDERLRTIFLKAQAPEEIMADINSFVGDAPPSDDKTYLWVERK